MPKKPVPFQLTVHFDEYEAIALKELASLLLLGPDAKTPLLRALKKVRHELRLARLRADKLAKAPAQEERPW